MLEQDDPVHESYSESYSPPDPDVHSILTSSPFLFFTVDREGTFLGMNAAAEAFFGHGSEELLHRRRFTRFVHPSDRSKASGAIGTAQEAGGDGTTLRVRWPNGHLRVLNCRFCWDPASGQVLVWARDTTEGRAVREELQARIDLLQDLLSKRTRALADLQTYGESDPLFQRIPVGILRLDESLRIHAANPAACRILGLPEEGPSGSARLGQDLFAFERDFLRLRTRLREGERVRGFLAHLKRADEWWIQVRVDANVVSDGLDDASHELYLFPLELGARETRRVRTTPRPRWTSNPGSLEMRGP